MGAGTSPADGTHAAGAAGDAGVPGDAGTSAGTGAVAAGGREKDDRAGHEEPAGAGHEEPAGTGSAEPVHTAEVVKTAEAGEPAEPGDPTGSEEGGGSTRAPSRRFSLTRDTARPEGGGRAASGDAPAPARQWPLLAVLCTAGIGLLLVGADPFTEAFRIGTMLIGLALLTGAVLRWVVPSVGMLAVRSRFTDLVTYGLMGTLIVLLALMAQPKPWLDVPFLQDAVHFTIR
ncbi:DUF3017 domain-containing protein [Streptomyces sp. B1I3]|uniref:DUF3017 domain-containing protein n=1 Tax=Streptomyces sp. B1I3 TaxID=3042264 RepID=UPI002783663E|nr:DUF3017 domain-containing protein [Streptomyces sp. B1I3]MDQ0794438.1 hypothetical protein [Streptomyces sp. B1I3]